MFSSSVSVLMLTKTGRIRQLNKQETHWQQIHTVGARS